MWKRLREDHKGHVVAWRLSMWKLKRPWRTQRQGKPWVTWRAQRPWNTLRRKLTKRTSPTTSPPTSLPPCHRSPPPLPPSPSSTSTNHKPYPQKENKKNWI